MAVGPLVAPSLQWSTTQLPTLQVVDALRDLLRFLRAVQLTCFPTIRTQRPLRSVMATGKGSLQAWCFYIDLPLLSLYYSRAALFSTCRYSQ